MNTTKQIFIVGSSRSGTTMMGRIINNHRDVYTFKELHFFSRIVDSKINIKLNRSGQIKLLARLFCVQKEGIFNQKEISNYYSQSEELLSEDVSYTPMEVYAKFLSHITSIESKSISCEQTPNNIYYIDEILHHFPNAKVINMVRDQRAVLCSQKNKWRRRFLGSKKIPIGEMVRSYFNYHPILTAKIWERSLKCTSNIQNHNRVSVVRFEDLLSSPRQVINDLCIFLDISYSDNMLEVPLIGSSLEKDNKHILMIDKSRSNKWKKGGLTKSEIYLSQLFSYKMMRRFSYPLHKLSPPPLSIIIDLSTFPVKLFFSLLLNIFYIPHIIRIINKKSHL